MRLGGGGSLILALGELDVFGNVHKHRAWTARCGNVKRLVDCTSKLIGVFHKPVVFRAGARDANGVGFLKCVRADHECRHLTGQNDHWDAVQKRIRKACHRVCGAWTRRHQNDTGFACRAGIAFGGMGRALLVADQNVVDVALLKNLVIDRQHRATGVAENRVDALFFKGLDNNLGACHGCGHLGLSGFQSLRGWFRVKSIASSFQVQKRKGDIKKPPIVSGAHGFKTG